MKITNFVRTQLLIFSVVTVVAMLAVGILYVRIPQMFGLGVYKVSLDLPSTGGSTRMRTSPSVASTSARSTRFR